jgi:tetratricopeptide (TPR) repeat protein
MPTAQQKYQKAVELIRDQSNFSEGRQLMIEALREDASMADGWYWLARTIQDPAKQRECLDRALKLDPQHEAAIKLRDRVEFQLLNAPSPEPEQAAPPAKPRTGVTALLGGSRLGSTGPLQGKAATGPLERKGGTGMLGGKAATAPLEPKAATGPLKAGQTGPLNPKAATGPLLRGGATGRLNEPLSKLQGTFKLSGGELGRVLLFLLLLIALAVGAVAALPQVNPQLGLPAFVPPILWVVLVIAGLLILALLYKLVMMLGSQLELYENGLAYTRSGRRVEWKWEALSALRVTENTLGSDPFSWKAWSMQLFDRDGKEALRFSQELQEYLRAAGIIDRLTTPIWLEEANAAFQRGKVVPFGPVNVSAAGIERKGERVRFDDVESWNVRTGEIMQFVVKGASKPVLIPVKDVPNRAVLIRLVDKILGI